MTEFRDRIMVYLNILSRKSGSSVVTVKMNREQQAQFLCVSRSALSNELNKMKREKIIDFNKEKFEIL
ncbi:MAG: helix-turn-helix domain-containing protein [Bacillota bacterium]|nr:helix-turn-helix domain-containing protein [Bacillota bacterium]